jgi:signal transduction histidine kinase
MGLNRPGLSFFTEKFWSFKNFSVSLYPSKFQPKMKSRLYVLILLLATLALGARADNLGYTKEHPLKFAIDLDYPPMEFVDDNGKPSGFDVEFTEILMERLNIPFTYAPNTWENVADDILKSRVDLGMMVYSPYRKHITNYSEAVFRLYYQLVSRKGHENKEGLRNVEGKTYAFMKSQPVIDTLTAGGATCVLIKDLKKALYELSKGQYDGVICYRYQARYLIETYHLGNLVPQDLTLMPREYCYVSHDKRLIEAINQELEKMEKEGVIDDVYGEVRSKFGDFVIPAWIWALIAFIIIASLGAIIIQQNRSRKRVEKEMRRAQENEQRALKSEELKDIFLNNVSHALRTPLNAIIGFSDLMMETPPEEMKEDERQQLLGLINSNGLQLLHLINELLSLSNIEGNEKLFNHQVTDIDHEMDSYASEIRLQLTEGVTLEVEEPAGGIRALTDPNMLRMVIMHLLENAQQHTKKGKITLTYYVKEGGIYTEVRDTGDGLPEDLKENIFALLSDKHTYTQENTPGLGLSICKAIIDKSGGKIGARDNDIDGRGSIFWVWMPSEILN